MDLVGNWRPKTHGGFDALGFTQRPFGWRLMKRAPRHSLSWERGRRRSGLAHKHKQTGSRNPEVPDGRSSHCSILHGDRRMTGRVVRVCVAPKGMSGQWSFDVFRGSETVGLVTKATARGLRGALAGGAEEAVGVAAVRREFSGQRSGGGRVNSRQ